MRCLMRMTALILLMIGLSGTPVRAFWPFTADEPAPTPAADSAALAVMATLADAKQPERRGTDESAVVRVLLKSLGQPAALGLTLSGAYTVEWDKGFRFARDTSIAVAVQGGSLLLSCGGVTIDMGPSFTLTRHAVKEGQENGIRIHEAGENLFAGDLALSIENGAIAAVLSIDVEDYLYGVVPYEMSDSFPIEALKAQAVAARTFVMSRRAPSKAYDVVDTPTDQVFKGLNPKNENAIAAVDATRGVVGLYNDGYATCYFTASNGGQTAMPDQLWGGQGDFGWLTVRDDPFDLDNPSSPVKTLTLSADPNKLDKRLHGLLRDGLTESVAALGYSDELADIKILRLVSVEPSDPKFGEGNRMFRKIRVGMTVEGKKLYAPDPTPDAQTTPLNEVMVVPETLYVELDFYGTLKRDYGLKISGSDCEIASVVPMLHDKPAAEGETPDGFRVESRRFGHGVGMSQRGAQQMAHAHGATWTQILTFYYPGMTLIEADYAREPLPAIEALTTSLGKARPRPTPKPTPAPLPALEQGESYAKVSLGSNSSTLNVRDAATTEGALKGTLDNGQRVIIVQDMGNGWAKIKTAELSGYASLDYLTKE